MLLSTRVASIRHSRDHGFSTRVSVVIYVSSAGRLFVRKRIANGRSSRGKDIAPGEGRGSASVGAHTPYGGAHRNRTMSMDCRGGLIGLIGQGPAPAAFVIQITAMFEETANHCYAFVIWKWGHDHALDRNLRFRLLELYARHHRGPYQPARDPSHGTGGIDA